jgi:ESS family glutamate:Na+ symporter
MGSTIVLSALASLLAGCLVLTAGFVLTERVSLLARFSIPAPIVGGLLFAALTLLVRQLGGVSLTLDTSARSSLLLLFFASIGLTADIGLLRRGGPRLLRFLAALFPFLVVQNALGVLLAKLLGLHPVLGLVAGSVTLVGGHGTGAAYAERFAQDFDLLGLMGLTMTSATIGLVLGGVIGGPVAGRLIRRLKIREAPAVADGGVALGPATTPVTTFSLMVALSAALIAAISGEWVAGLLEGSAVTVPSFLWCLLAGLILRNGGAALGVRIPAPACELLGSSCLSLFLVWTMMTLDLASVATLAGPLLVILAAQAVLVAAWASWVVFRLVGRDYEAAVTAGAFCGFAMGATATAIANMQALARRWGPAPESTVLVPIVGAFFVDLMNLAVLTVFLASGLFGGG